jgi:hydroxymethylpyrimidine pyrophosphatase-like HAD family hydrolase
MSKQKIIAFDLDDVLCHRSNQFENLGPLKYSYCIPNKKMIELVNSLYDDGHKIVIYTARGMTQFNGNVIEIYGQLYTKTLNNLDEWGLKYHQLVMGKKYYKRFNHTISLWKINYEKRKINNRFCRLLAKLYQN